MVGAQIEELHEHFNRVRAGRVPLKLTADRRRKYRARLKVFSVPELKQAIEAALGQEFYRGANDDGTRYDFPETVLKNDGAVDRHLQLERGRAEEAVHDRERDWRAAAGTAWVQIWSAARRGYEPPLQSPSAVAAYGAVKQELALELGLGAAQASDALLTHFLEAYLEHRRGEEETEEGQAEPE